MNMNGIVVRVYVIFDDDTTLVDSKAVLASGMYIDNDTRTEILYQLNKIIAEFNGKLKELNDGHGD